MAAFVLTAGMVAHATRGHLVGGAPDRAFDSVSIDSRTADGGSLFIALRGQHFDGHAFIADVVARGAAGLLVSSAVVADGLAVIVVPDTLEALQRLGRDVRRQSDARVVAITGSAGKTTTKEVTAEFLSARYRVFRNRGNLNNHIGLPLSLLELRHAPEMAVVELGMNHAGEIRALIAMAEPNVRVWTNAGDAHIGHFTSRETLAEAKAELLEHATPDTLVVANEDDALVMAHVAKFTGRRLTFGEGPRADVRATNILDRGFDGTSADVQTPSGHGHLTVPLAGRAQLSNVLAAATVALDLGVPWSAIEDRARTLRAVDRRGVLTSLPNGARLVDDSYNASPAAMQAMLLTLRATPVVGRRVAVLGEMLELGAAGPMLHEACGRTAAAAGVDELIVVGGPAADFLAAGAQAAGVPRSHIHRFSDSAGAAAGIAALVRAGDLVLVKGSRGVRMDLIADALMREGGAV